MIVRWLGSVPYREALEAQRAHREALIEGRVGDELWLLEHPPVITTGRRVVTDLEPRRIVDAGYDLVVTERGGLATCHEPGQLVGYLLMDARDLGVWRTVAAVEDGLIDWVKGRGAAAGRREGYPGVWVGREKVAAVGLHFRLGRTLHGFALNLVNDLRGFGLVTPCGITDGGVTSMARLVEGAPSPAEAAAEIGAAVISSLDAAQGIVNRGGTEGT